MQTITKKVKIKMTVFYYNILKIIYYCGGKAEFSAAITPVFSVTRSFRNDAQET